MSILSQDLWRIKLESLIHSAVYCIVYSLCVYSSLWRLEEHLFSFSLQFLHNSLSLFWNHWRVMYFIVPPDLSSDLRAVFFLYCPFLVAWKFSHIVLATESAGNKIRNSYISMSFANLFNNEWSYLPRHLQKPPYFSTPQVTYAAATSNTAKTRHDNNISIFIISAQRKAQRKRITCSFDCRPSKSLQ